MEKNISTFEVLKRQFKTIKANKKSYLYVLYIVNMICAGTLPTIAVIIPKLIIDAFGSSSLDSIYTYIGIFAGVSLILSIIIVILNNITTADFLTLRMNEFDRLANLMNHFDYKYLEDSKFMDKLDISTETLSGDGMGYQYTFTLVYQILPLLMSSILYVVIISTFNLYLIIVCILSSILIMLINSMVKKYAYSKKEEEAHANRQSTYFYNTTYDFTYGKDIRIYDLSNKIKKDFKDKNYNYISVIRNIKNHEFKLGMWQLLLLLIQDGLAYFLVIKGYYDGLISLGDMTLYIGAIIALNTAFRDIGIKFSELKDATRYTKDYFKFLDDKSLFSFQGTHQALKETFEIEFKNVSFKYPGTDNHILKDFNFKINKGEKLAIVGMNGAGKSTIVKLITGLFRPTSGQILVDGIDSQEFAQDEYFKMFSAVFQDINIYAGSVIENVMGKDIGEENRKIAKLCIKKVGLKNKIESLPKGYDHPLLKVMEEDGVELSGGESQKLAIARALYKNGQVVILDEPTAALDALAEADIYQKFSDLVEGKTAIYISHRLSSTKFCDHIALFSKEGLIEYGTHSELMKQKGEYYHMFTVQGKYYQESGDNND